jgi:hypothetical protein
MCGCLLCMESIMWTLSQGMWMFFENAIKSIFWTHSHTTCCVFPMVECKLRWLTLELVKTTTKIHFFYTFFEPQKDLIVKTTIHQSWKIAFHSCVCPTKQSSLKHMCTTQHQTWIFFVVIWTFENTQNFNINKKQQKVHKNNHQLTWCKTHKTWFYWNIT